MPTWCDNCGHGHTFQMTLGSEDTDVVLRTQIQALQHARGLISSDKLFQGVSSLAAGRRARHSVACDACRGLGNMTKVEAAEHNVKRFLQCMSQKEIPGRDICPSQEKKAKV